LHPKKIAVHCTDLKLENRGLILPPQNKASELQRRDDDEANADDGKHKLGGDVIDP